MSKKIHLEVDLAGATAVTFINGISCRNPLGFLFMWTYFLAFIVQTRRAEGCLTVLPGLISPRRLVLVTYWSSPEQLTRFIRSKGHMQWMAFIYRHPASLNLFNETYGAPVRAHYINTPDGYAGATSGGPAKGLPK